MSARVNYFLDTEFIEDGRTIDIISIGVVCEDGRELYLCNSDCDLSRANDWVKENVVPHLPPRESEAWVPKVAIAGALARFAPTRPRFWAYYADYDWVAVCQLFGSMLDLPKHFPMLCFDLKQWADQLGVPREASPAQKQEHHALADARWNQELWRVCDSFAPPKPPPPLEAIEQLKEFFTWLSCPSGCDDEMEEQGRKALATIEAHLRGVHGG